MSEVKKGTVKWFNDTKGFGFIEPEGGSTDVFVHISAVKEAGIDNLEEYDEVEFEIGENRGKENAINLKKI